MKAHNLQVTGSLTTGGEAIGSISSSVATTTLGLGSRITTIEGKSLVSGSGQIPSLLPSGVVSGSAQTIANLPSGVVSGSAQTLANLPSGTVSGSVQVDVMSTTNIARLATTGSNTFQGNQTINGSLVVTGSLTAQQFIVSSSVTYLTESFASGSHKFGDTSDDTHQFTGSVYISSGSYFNVGRGSDNSYPFNVTSQFAKTDTSGRGLIFLGSNEAIASNPFGLVVTVTGAASLSSRTVTIGTTDFGLANGGTLNLNNTLYVTGSNGNIGAGTSSPRTRLQVTPISNAEVPVLGTATGIATFTSANGNYGLQFNSTSDGSFHIQSQRFDASATAYSLILNYAGGNVGIGGNTAPGCALDISSRTDAISLPKGTTAQRPATSVAGMGRFNTTTTRTEFYNGSVWVNVGGNADGSTSASAAASAKAIKQVVGNPTSGVYWLQVANVNGGNPFQCYCDFTMDGGVGYAIIVNQYFAGAQTGPSHANFASTTIGTAGFETGYVVSPSAMLANYGLTKLAVFARTGGVTTGGITGSTYYNWVSFTGPSTTQFNNIFTNGYGTNQFTGTFNSSDGNTGTAYFPNSHGNTGGVTQITTNGGTVNNYTLYEYNANGGTDPNHFWMVLNGRDGDTYWVTNTRYGSSSGNVMYNRWGGVALY